MRLAPRFKLPDSAAFSDALSEAPNPLSAADSSTPNAPRFGNVIAGRPGSDAIKLAANVSPVCDQRR